MNETKRCSKCGEEKAFKCFGKHIRLKYGIRSACKECERKAYPCKKRTDEQKARERKNERIERLNLTDNNIKKMIWREAKTIGQTIAFKDMTKEMIEEKRQAVIEYRSKPKSFLSCKVYFNKCIICQEIFTTRYKKENACSDKCQHLSWAKYQRGIYQPKPKTERICKICGELFKSNRPTERCCSDNCKEINGRLMNDKNHKRRARRLNVEYEYINPLKVFIRDGWHCQICGKATPIKNRGKFYPNAPELDHRIPMSKGGDHLYSNVQCACRKCNGEKSNKDNRGQMPLFEVAAIAG